MRYFIELSYQGTNYCGWQNQPNATSVQSVIENALSVLLREKTEVVGAGRTDAGVHASYYVAHFDCQNKIDCEKLVYRLNGFLPHDIAIKKIIEVKPDAHARFDATYRTYHYQISQVKNPFVREFAFYYHFPLDVGKMNEAAALLFNYSDFTSFSKLHTDAKTNICKIYEALWSKQNDLFIFNIKADRFLRNMVRAIVGTLMDVGMNKISIEDFKQIIENKNRCDAGISVPAKGLFLVDIGYQNQLRITN